jgi:hypothetical protein
MVGLISTIVGHREASVNPNRVAQLQRLEQAAGFSMAAFDTDDDLTAQPDVEEKVEAPNDSTRIAHRMAAMIDECTSAVTSYLRPAI